MTRAGVGSRPPGPSAAVAVALGLALTALGCAPGGGARRPPSVEPAPPSPTPQVSLSPEIASTAAVVRQAVAAAGFRFDRSTQVYRPSEPASVASAPRAVFRLDLADRDLGHVVVYAFPDADAASRAGRELAAHVGSGFGQTNYPLDAQFAISQLGSTLVFTWWSRERSSEPRRAEAGFRAVTAVGQPIPVQK